MFPKTQVNLKILEVTKKESICDITDVKIRQSANKFLDILDFFHVLSFQILLFPSFCFSLFSRNLFLLFSIKDSDFKCFRSLFFFFLVSSFYLFLSSLDIDIILILLRFSFFYPSFVFSLVAIKLHN